MASLVGQQLKDTYDSLLKTSDNDALGGTYKEITDGSGNGSNLYLGTGGNVGIGTDSPSVALQVHDSLGTTLDDGVLRLIDDTSYAQNVGAAIALGFKYNSGGSVMQRGGVIKAIKENTTDGNYASALLFGTTANSASTTERMRIDSSGNVQLASSEQAIQWASGNGIVQAPTNLYIRTSSSGGNLLFQVNNDEKMRIDSSGNVTITTGNLILDSGAGIDFSDTANSSGTMTSELLDDYEEGTWTPVLRGASTAGTYEFATSNAHYTKVGRMVNITANLVLSASVTGGGTGYAKITGLPYGKAAGMAPQGSVLFRSVDFADDADYVTVEFVSSGTSSEIYFPATIDNSSGNDTNISAFGNSSIINLSLTYFT